MRAEPECIPCILKDIEEAGRLILKDREKESLLLKKSMEFLTEEFNGRKTPPYYITRVHRFLKQISGLDIPFAERRSRCNEIGIDVAKEIEKEVESLNGYDRFAEIVLWVVAGNTIDFRTVGSGYDSDLAAVEEKWREIHNRDLALDDRKKLWEVLQKSQRVLYIPDNVGELALDGLLIKFINKMDKKLILGMRGGAITSDATMEDAKRTRYPRHLRNGDVF
jgi:uncharacterized protein with ATP-grasp and redox domains